MTQQYYAHFPYLSKGQTRNLNTLTINSQPMVVMSNDSAVQIYEYTPQGLTLHRTLEFHCTIKKLVVLSNKHHESDYLFILDKEGRYAFWQPDGGFQFVQNHINSRPQHLDLYKQSIDSVKSIQFCSHTHSSEVLDTKGSIFFNIGQEITLIDYSIKSMGLKVQKAKRIKLQVIKYRFAGWVQNPKHERWLGLIVQSEEKTILKVYNLDKLTRICAQNQVFSYQKINLMQFASPSLNRLLLLADNEVTLLQLKSQQTISSYGIKDRFGKMLLISKQLYGYICEQLVLFSGLKIKSYGSLSISNQNMLGGKGVAEVKFHRDLGDGGKLVSIVTMTNQIFFIILYENVWKLCHRMECITPIFSINQMANHRLIAVLSNGISDKYEVAIIEREIVMSFLKQQKYDSLVQRVTAIHGGNTLLVSSKDGIISLQHNQHSGQFDLTSLSIPNEELLAANDHYCVTTKAVYSFSLSQNTSQKLYSDQIVMAITQNTDILFINCQLQVMSINSQSQETYIVRTAACTEYAWHLVNSILIVFQSNDLQNFYIYRGAELIAKIKLKHNVIVSSVTHQKFGQTTVLVIGFVDGYITVLNFQDFETVTSFQNYANQPIQMEKVQNLIVASSKSRQFLLKFTPQPTLQQIQLFSSDSSLKCLAYVQSKKQLIVVQKCNEQASCIIKTASVKPFLQTPDLFFKNSYSFKKKPIISFDTQIPVVYVENNFIFVAVAKEIHIYNATTRLQDQLINNFYADVIGIQRIQYGILVYGIDQLLRNILTLIDPITHQVLSTIPLILKDNRYIKSIKSLGSSSNRLICRAQKYTSLFQLTDNYELSELSQITSDFQGYFLDIDPKNQLFGITDSFRFAAFYSYSQQIVPISRFVSKAEINELALLDRSVVVCDRTGKLTILEYNVQSQSQPLRMLMSEVVSLQLGSEINNLSKVSPYQMLYSTADGKIGIIKIIKEEEFSILKEAEGEMLRECEKKSGFDYKKWTNREPKEDKLVDCELVAQYLEQKSLRGQAVSSKENYRQILRAYNEISRK